VQDQIRGDFADHARNQKARMEIVRLGSGLFYSSTDNVSPFAERNGEYLMDTEPYKQAIRWASTAGLGIIVLFSVYDDIRNLVQHQFELLLFLYICLFIVIIILGGSWIQSGLHELNLLSYWLAEAHYTPPKDITIIGTIVGVGCLIGALAVSARWITIFAVALLIYHSVDLIWSYVRRKEIREAIDSAKTYVKSTGGRFPNKSEALLSGIEEVEHYYFIRPQNKRIIFSITATALTLVISLSDKFYGITAGKAAAYILFIIQFLASEITIQYWRVVRDRKLRIIQRIIEF
jgi:predicted Na+-dependent transporter